MTPNPQEPHKTDRVERLSYRIPEVAEALAVSVATVWRVIKRGELRTFKIGSATLVSAEDLRAMIARAQGLGDAA